MSGLIAIIETGTGMPLAISVLIILNIMILISLPKGVELTAMLGFMLNALLAAFAYWITTEKGATGWDYLYPLVISIGWLIIMALLLLVSEDHFGGD